MSASDRADSAAQLHGPNRLADQPSPYLLQHAHNPVDWWPWGRDAIERARSLDRPILLSIGYSTCYWCHVMERESFEDPGTAELINSRFVPIKVDREEHPEIDEIYMAATVITTGRGGWPMTVFLEPHSLNPFYCGTYFPKDPGHGMPSFTHLLTSMANAWPDKRADVIDHARAIADAAREHLAAQRAEPVRPTLALAQNAAGALLRSLDTTHGGFSSAPKFPQPVLLDFLLDIRALAADPSTRDASDNALRITLDAMAIGGIHDHLAGGFHRYCVDATWTVPHFEKMLYDNAQLALTYARASEALDDPFYARVARRTLDYILRELAMPRDSDAGFASAQDAEVDSREGLNYLWTPTEVRDALDDKDAELAIKMYGLDASPNFRDPHHPEDPPRHVLRLGDRPDRLARSLSIEPEELAERLESINASLLRIRDARPKPLTDDKVIASWNALAITALAGAAGPLGEARYLDAARDAARFVLRSMRDERGGLRRSIRDDTAGPGAVLEDYAAMILACAALCRAQADSAESATHHLDHARGLYDTARELFWDEDAATFCDTPPDRDDLYLRPRTVHDGPIPSPASMLLHAQLDLYQLTSDARYLDDAVASIASISGTISETPVGCTSSLRALLRLLADPEGARRLQEIPSGSSESGTADGTTTSDTFTPVEIYADTERLTVTEQNPDSVRVVLRIKDGYHVLAADPGPAGRALLPLRVHVINGGGIAAYADYPDGNPSPHDPDLLVHTGDVEFTIAVERSGEWWGRPLLAITYQACTHDRCLNPMTVELDVAIDSS